VAAARLFQQCNGSSVLKIVSWNVNSIKMRLPLLQEWVRTNNPDVLLLQELKCEEASFPLLECQAMGFECAVVGQKSYNGVAILSRHAAKIIHRQLPGDNDDGQARYLEADIKGIRIINIYLPNGNPIAESKFDYKLSWMRRLRQRMQELVAEEIPVVIGGDFNVIPAAADAHNIDGWEMDALHHPKTLHEWRQLLAAGYTDIFRALHPTQKHAFTFWDYQAGAWHRDAGIRIDHFLASPEIVDRTESCTIDRAPRGAEKASDHTPIILEVTV
jgi:exodeoxyribonuclease III